MSALEVKNLSVKIGAQQILRNISISVPERSIVCILGANGAGKTTLMRTITGIYPPSGGSIKALDQDITGLPSHKIVRGGLAHAPEGRHLFSSMTVLENLRVGAIGLTGADFDSALERVLALFPPIRPRLKQHAGSLSGGEQQMVCLARGLMSRPRLFLLDEPSLGLAPMMVEQIFELVTRVRSAGTAILLVEQNARAALQVGDYAYLMEGGRMVLEGAAAVLLNDHRVESAYLGGHVQKPA